MNGGEIAPGVVFERALSGDTYTGTEHALLAAGLVEPHQLPGAPGNGLTMASFLPDGRKVGMGNSTACKQPGYLQVRRISRGRLCVLKGIGKAASDARRHAYLAQLDEKRQQGRCWPFPILAGAPV